MLSKSTKSLHNTDPLPVSPDTINPHIGGNWVLNSTQKCSNIEKEIIANATKIDSANAEGRS